MNCYQNFRSTFAGKKLAFDGKENKATYAGFQGVYFYPGKFNLKFGRG